MEKERWNMKGEEKDKERDKEEGKKEQKVELDHRGKMILAPMVKIGRLPFRLLALEMGADIVYTEEIIDFRLIRSNRMENRKGGKYEIRVQYRGRGGRNDI